MAESLSRIQPLAPQHIEPSDTHRDSQPDRAFETLIHRIHHDLNGPLASIAGLVQIARMESELPAVFSHLDNIHKLSNKLTGILEELMQISHLHGDTPSFHEVSLEEEIQTVVSGFSEWPEARGIELTMDTEDVHFVSDPNRLRNVLAHLVANSIHHHDSSKTNQWISISTRKQDDTITICVKDNGQGIDPAFLGKVFDMFSVGGNHGGSGLGLYLAKVAIQSLGGEIRILSEKGEGTEVNIYFTGRKSFR